MIVCIGNDLVADDAAGHEIYLRLRNPELPIEVRLEYAAVGGIALLDRLTGRESTMIVVDAVQFGSPPGTIHCLNWDELPDLGVGALSGHDIGLRETVAIGRLLYPDKLPERIVLVGIEGRCFNRTRAAMTPETAAALDDAVLLIRNMLMHQRGP
ncbi:MAG: peptidase [Geobacteraceae bacterium GWC2_55_20]|nr:MAG: peptidase [Geobacteraceae bacterium GWC2_55_20]OGU22681.1 MAG: peptidase [Geobacteraceae bacterium GWF2_54_21]HBA70968.1 peptidase [Geobacter sp.]HCE66936.1 peptidase [Geobacter sp.]